jgi:hypothetical protein
MQCRPNVLTAQRFDRKGGRLISHRELISENHPLSKFNHFRLLIRRLWAICAYFSIGPPTYFSPPPFIANRWLSPLLLSNL